MSRWFMLALFLFAPVARGQVFAVTAGDSSLFDAAGASLVRYTPTSTDTFSGGIINNHLLFGFNHLMSWHGLLLDVGDQSEPFVLPSDFSPNSRIYGRGLSIRRTRKDEHGVTISDLRIFLGSESVQFGTPFLTTAKTTGTPLLFLSYTRQFSPKLRFESHEIFSSRQTALESISYDVGKTAQVAGTAGAGSNEKYLAAEIFVKRSWVVFRGAEIVASERFSRITPEPFVYSATENKGLNFQTDFAPISRLHLVATRIGMLSQVTGQTAVVLGQSSVASTSSSAGMFGSLSMMTVSANIYEGSALGRSSSGDSFGVGARFWDGKIQEQAMMFRGSFGSILSNNVTLIVNRHLRLSQFYTNSSGRQNFSAGGSWVSNEFTADISHQEMFDPVSASLGRGEFQRTTAITLTVRLPHSSAATVSGLTGTGNGKLRWAAYGSSYFYQNGATGGPEQHRSFGKVVFQGTVADSAGVGVEGIAVRIGKNNEVWTDSDGHFELRVKHAAPESLTISIEDSTAPGAWHVLSCPSTISFDSRVKITVSR